MSYASRRLAPPAPLKLLRQAGTKQELMSYTHTHTHTHTYTHRAEAQLERANQNKKVEESKGDETSNRTPAGRIKQPTGASERTAA
jgi:hypothetical protein